MTPALQTPDRVTAIILLVHIIVLFGCFVILGAVFEFPDVLRYPAAERFSLFSANHQVIQSAYWALTMTGVTQMLFSVLLLHSARAQHLPVGTIALIFGVLAGFCQALGFGRWVILIPYLVAEAGVAENLDTAILLEGAFNRYSGMLVGEHLANIFWGIWLAAINIAFLKATDLSRGLCWFGLALSPFLMLLAGEQIGVSGEVLDPLVDFGFPLLAVWHILLAIQLLRRRGGLSFPPLTLVSVSFAVMFGAGMIASALI